MDASIGEGGGESGSRVKRKLNGTFVLPSANGVTSTPSPSNATLCAFCQRNNAAIVVMGQLVSKPLCLLHYYTTRAIRIYPTPKIKVVGDGSELKLQLPAVQSIFAEAFMELKQDIAEESAKAFQEIASLGGNDPLASLHDRKSVRGRKSSSYSSESKPSMRAKHGRDSNRYINHKCHNKPSSKDMFQAEEDDSGGFVRDIAIPERYLRQQEKNSILSLDNRPLIARATAAAANLVDKDDESGSEPTGKEGRTELKVNPYKRRKGGNQSYWNLSGITMNDKQGRTPKKKKLTLADLDESPTNVSSSLVCTCGSTDIDVNGNASSRKSNDMAKAETWGNKDRSDEVVVRCICSQCGRAWNESG